jgi:hypothetical protein
MRRSRTSTATITKLLARRVNGRLTRSSSRLVSIKWRYQVEQQYAEECAALVAEGIMTPAEAASLLAELEDAR